MTDQTRPIGDQTRPVGVVPVTPTEELLVQIRDEIRQLNAHLAGDPSAVAPATQRRTGEVRTSKPKAATE